MEVFETENFYIFVKREKSLWWNRNTSEFTIKAGWDLSAVDDIECIGITPGIIGVISLPNVYEPHLVIIKEAVPMGVLFAPNIVYKIKSICILSADEPDATLAPCPRHSSSNSTPTRSRNTAHINTTSGQNNTTTSTTKSKFFEGALLMNKTWGAVKSAGNTIKNTTQHAAAIASNQVKSSVGIKNPTRFEKRITDELHKMFDDTDSFYYSIECDITNNLQRHGATAKSLEQSISEQSWDERFFWNMHMINDIINLKDPMWVLPVIQGFVQVENSVINNECFTLALVSRRSRHRAGTRYKRRGVDEKGNCANYVETEQILSFQHHQLSFTQVRGSVPIYWSQTSYKYRPPPRLDCGEEKTQIAFERHFTQELEIYKAVCIVNLVEQNGKEKLIGDAFAKHVVKYNNSKIIYVTFDFHDFCRGMRFENVSSLVEALAPEAGAMGFHWRDRHGVICNQTSVFRVNCMDCLDRTNVVQTAISKAVLESQLVKLGLAPPYTPIPEQMKAPFMLLWANNGDIISRQYAGTNALKGDYTRTGERKISGMMKDGMNSANRYYLALFKDFCRQITIDLMLGHPVSAESLKNLGGQVVPDELDPAESAEHAKMLVEDCRRMLFGADQHPVGSWGLIDAHPSTGNIKETEVDSILLLTDSFYIVAEYDSNLDKIVRFEKVYLQDITLVELGLYQQPNFFKGPELPLLCLRLNYMLDGEDGYFHMLRAANLRFANNCAYVIKSQEEVMEFMTSIVEVFRIVLTNIGKSDVPIIVGRMLERRKSKLPLLDVPKGMPRNLSESQLLQLSSKAISNVAGQFSKLGQTFNTNKNKIQHKPQSMSGGSESINSQISIDKCVEANEKIFFTVSGKNPNSNTSSDSEEQDSSIYEPDVELALSASDDTANSNFKENTFLPSVGIVMGQSNNHQSVRDKEKHNNSANVQVLSISTVMDHVSLPTGLLENAPPMRPITPNPEICVVNSSDGCVDNDDGDYIKVVSRPITPNFMTSARSGSNSPTEASRSISQLKTMTSPLTKLAKGMQNLGLNLDPRKMTSKSVGASADITPPERSVNNRAQLLEMWEDSKCQTKLIAL